MPPCQTLSILYPGTSVATGCFMSSLFVKSTRGKADLSPVRWSFHGKVVYLASNTGADDVYEIFSSNRETLQFLSVRIHESIPWKNVSLTRSIFLTKFIDTDKTADYYNILLLHISIEIRIFINLFLFFSQTRNHALKIILDPENFHPRTLNFRDGNRTLFKW